MKTIINLGIFILVFTTSIRSQINIPDNNFKAALIEAGVDLNNNGEIEISEAEQVERLHIIYKGITSLEGIQFFSALKHLDCRGNAIVELNMDGNPLLEELYAERNQANTIINVSNNPELKRLDFSFNSVVSIDLSNNPNLEYLKVEDNPTNELDLSNNTNLKVLRCTPRGGTIQNLDLTNNVLLEALLIGGAISNVDITNNVNLLAISMVFYGGSEPDISNCPNLRGYYIRGRTSFTQLDFTNNPNLELIELLFNGQITEIDISQCDNFKILRMRDVPGLQQVCANNKNQKVVRDELKRLGLNGKVKVKLNCPQMMQARSLELSPELLNDNSSVGLTETAYDISGNSLFKVYPNPSTETVTIISSSAIERIELFDLSGRQMFSYVFLEGLQMQQELNVEEFTSGFYVLMVKTNGGLQQTKLIIK